MTKFSVFKRFIKNTSGNFALTLALAILPIMLGVGAAVDFTGATREQGRLQSALDSATLAVGEDFMFLKKPEIKKRLRAYLKANLSQSEYQQIDSLIVTIDKKANTMTVDVKGKSDTSFMMLAGFDKLDYDAVAQISSASGGAEIVFVLDMTGSMNSDGKLASLKTAAKNFTNTIMPENTGGIVDIGIVPFSNHVNVGLSRRSASWLNVLDDTSTTEDKCETKYRNATKSNCRTETRYSDGVPYETEICDWSYSDPYEECGPKTTSSTWHGCVGSRAEPLNLEDRGYGTHRVPGLLNTWCAPEITPLTNVKSTIISNIDAMTASGSTYIPAGLTWGLRLLSSKAPFEEAVSKSQAAKKNIKKILILMTDGDNTQSAQLPGSPHHWGSDITQANLWTTQSCNLIKAEQTSVYTITFGSLLDETKALIKGCASNHAQYFHAATGNELQEVFDKIRSDIMELHLSM